MAMSSPDKKTPLHAQHVALGARMISFGGFDMPIQYSGIIDEHMAVREAAGLFDVSHMGAHKPLLLCKTSSPMM